MRQLDPASFRKSFAGVSCSTTNYFRRTSARLTLASPSADAAGTLHLQPPSFDAVKAANTQVQATALAQLNLTGLDADVCLRGLDVVPLVSDEVALRQLAVQSGQPLRLKLNGRAKVSGTVQHQQPTGPSGAWQFAGDLGLESVRVNQLKLFQKLGGRLTVSDNSISVHGRGQRANETLDLDLSLPLLPGRPPAAPVDQEGQSGLPDDEVASAASASAADEAGSAAELPPRAAQRGGGGGSHHVRHQRGTPQPVRQAGGEVGGSGGAGGGGAAAVVRRRPGHD